MTGLRCWLISATLAISEVLYGEAVRVLNWHWDRELALIWLVTQQTQQQATARLQSQRQGEPVAHLSNEYFDELTDAVIALTNYIETNGSENELLEVLGKFSELTYITTGNGYYLVQKGHMT